MRSVRLLGLGLVRHLLLDFDQLAVALVIVVGGLFGLALFLVGVFLVVDDVDAHLVEHRVDVLDLVG